MTAAQYAAFLNAVAATDTYGLYNSSMSDTSTGCNIQQSGSSGSYTYSVAPQYANLPVNYITWGDAARFCNWLTNGQPTGSEDLATTENGSYYLNGATTDAQLLTVARTANARYVLPTENEWYKAAYLQRGDGRLLALPHAKQLAPRRGSPAGIGRSIGIGELRQCHVPDWLPDERRRLLGLPGAYGTFDQGGLLFQWTDTMLTAYYGSGFAMECSSFESAPSELASTNEIWPWSPADSDYNFCGFRVAEVPGTLDTLPAGGRHGSALGPAFAEAAARMRDRLKSTLAAAVTAAICTVAVPAWAGYSMSGYNLDVVQSGQGLAHAGISYLENSTWNEAGGNQYTPISTSFTLPFVQRHRLRPPLPRHLGRHARLYGHRHRIRQRDAACADLDRRHE